jgi:hypothetical protein
MTKAQIESSIRVTEQRIENCKIQIEEDKILLSALRHKKDLVDLQDAIDAKKVASESLPETTKPETDNNKAPSA